MTNHQQSLLIKKGCLMKPPSVMSYKRTQK